VWTGRTHRLVHDESVLRLEFPGHAPVCYSLGMAARAPYDDVAEAYSRQFDPDGAGLVDPVLVELVGDVQRMEVLSLACGQGQDARLLASLGASVIGVDVSSAMLDHARRHEAAQPRGIVYLEADAQELDGIGDARFDGVVCHMALMDIPRLPATLASVARVLQREGWFVFSIVHPCFHGHVEVAGDYLVDHRYAKRVPGDWLPRHAYHRPLGDYVNELDRLGLRLRRMAEVRHAADLGDGGVPGLLYARAEKS